MVGVVSHRNVSIEYNLFVPFLVLAVIFWLLLFVGRLAPKCVAQCVLMKNIYWIIVINVVIMPDNTPNTKHDLLMAIIQFTATMPPITDIFVWWWGITSHH